MRCFLAELGVLFVACKPQRTVDAPSEALNLVQTWCCVHCGTVLCGTVNFGSGGSMVLLSVAAVAAVAFIAGGFFSFGCMMDRSATQSDQPN